MNVFIVDDEPPARKRLREVLTDCSATLPLQIVGEASNGRVALEKLASLSVDVVLLDIRMPEMDGIEFAQHLQKLPRPPVVIFTTAYDDYAIKAFELHAVDYLLKPIRLARLHDALNRARDAVPVKGEVLQELATEPRKNLSIHERGHIYLIPIEKVLYLRAELKYITVRTVEREYLIEESLAALEKEFAVRFVRIHRNCLIAKETIVEFVKGGEDSAESAGWMVKLRGLDELLAISRRQQHIVKEFS